ncbi:hypothetical protein DZS_38300 [Dickeya ananatis]
MAIIRKTDAQHLPALNLQFADRRVEELLFRYRARNFPGTLDEQEQQRWLAHRREVFTTERLQNYFDTLDQLYQQHDGDEKKTTQLKALFAYAQQLLA